MATMDTFSIGIDFNPDFKQLDYTVKKVKDAAKLEINIPLNFIGLAESEQKVKESTQGVYSAFLLLKQKIDSLLRPILSRMTWGNFTSAVKSVYTYLWTTIRTLFGSFLGLVTGAVGSVIGAGTTIYRIGENIDRVFMLSHNVDTSIQGIRALQFAFERLGGSGNDAVAAVTEISKFIKENAGAEGYFHSLGVDIKDSKGQLRQMSDILIDLGKVFNKMKQEGRLYTAEAYGAQFGLNYQALLAMMNPEFVGLYSQSSKATGNIDAPAAKAHDTITQVKLALSEIEARFQLFALNILAQLSPLFTRFANWLQSHQADMDAFGNQIVAWLIAKQDTIITAGTNLINWISSINFEKIAAQAQELFNTVITSLKTISIALTTLSKASIVDSIFTVIDNGVESVVNAISSVGGMWSNGVNDLFHWLFGFYPGELIQSVVLLGSSVFGAISSSAHLIWNVGSKISGAVWSFIKAHPILTGIAASIAFPWVLSLWRIHAATIALFAFLARALTASRIAIAYWVNDAASGFLGFFSRALTASRVVINYFFSSTQQWIGLAVGVFAALSVAIKGFLQTAGHLFGATILLALNSLKGFFDAVKLIGSWLSTGFDWLYTKLDKVLSYIEALRQSMADWLSDLIEKISDGRIGKFFNWLFGGSSTNTPVVNTPVADTQTAKPQAPAINPVATGTTSNTVLGALSNSGFAKLLQRGESNIKNVDTYNVGIWHGYKPTTPLSQMTINQVMALQADHKLGAAGRFQLIPSTMLDTFKEMNLNPNDKFSPAMQERIFAESLIKHTKGLVSYLRGTGSVDAAIYGVSRQWASVQAPDKPGMQSAYAHNKATISVAEIREALLNLKSLVDRHIISVDSSGKIINLKSGTEDSSQETGLTHKGVDKVISAITNQNSTEVGRGLNSRQSGNTVNQNITIHISAENLQKAGHDMFIQFKQKTADSLRTTARNMGSLVPR